MSGREIMRYGPFFYHQVGKRESEMGKIRKRLAAVIIMGLAGFLALNVLAYNHARSMMFFSVGGDSTRQPEALGAWEKVIVLLTGVNLPRPSGRGVPADLAPDCEVLHIDGADGIRLEAWYCDRGASTPLVILFHGYAGDKTALLAEAREILALGASVLLVDFRGSGGSSEAYTTVGILESDDVATLFRFAEARLDHAGIVLFGQSMGAAAVLRAVHQHGIEPAGLILEAVFDTLLNTARNRFDAMRVPSFPSAQLLVFWGARQWGVNGFRHNPVRYAHSVRCPVLILHGEADPRATLPEGQRVYEAIASSKAFVAFAGSGHESYVKRHPHQWRAAVAAWFESLPGMSALW